MFIIDLDGEDEKDKGVLDNLFFQFIVELGMDKKDVFKKNECSVLNEVYLVVMRFLSVFMFCIKFGFKFFICELFFFIFSVIVVVLLSFGVVDYCLYVFKLLLEYWKS